MNDVRQVLRDSFAAAVAAVDPRACTARGLAELAGRELRGPVTLLAAGKAACTMAAGVVDALGSRALAGGLVVTKDGHTRGARLPASLELREAAHPAPDARSL